MLDDGQGFWLCHKRLSQGRFRPFLRLAQELAQDQSSLPWWILPAALTVSACLCLYAPEREVETA
ncbi:hypothetical protein [Desulfosoma sp.]